MAIKYCIAKDFGAVRLYFAGATNNTETWISYIKSPSVVLWNNEKDAQKALRGPTSYVVPMVYANKRVDALEACCKALRDAIDIGALSNLTPSLLVDRDVFEAAGILVIREENHENYSIRYGKLHGIELYCSVWGDSK